MINQAKGSSLIRRCWSIIKFHGPRGLFQAACRRISPPKAKCLQVCRELITNRTGLEIGGPSGIFARHGILPIYPLVEKLDNCNFATQTIWEGNLREGPHFIYDNQRPSGYQYIAEATELRMIPDSTYDFLLSSHVLEHLANPLKGLREWRRVLKDDGILILVVPHKDGTFDHRRPVTRLSHLIEDFRHETTEEDLTHLEEVLALHDLDIHPGGCDISTLRERSLKNYENRCLHQHVFDTALLMQVIDFAGFQICTVEAILPFHIILVARKPPTDQPASNSSFLGDTVPCLVKSPFRSDRERKT